MAKKNSPAPSQRRKKVLLLVTSTAGGVGRHTFYLAKHLPREDLDLTIAYGPGYPLDEAIESLDVPIVHLPFSRDLSPWANLTAAVCLYKLIKRERFDVVCVGCSIAALIGRVVGFLAGVPERVVVAHVFASQPDKSAFKKFFFLHLERALDRLTTRYVAVCEASKHFAVQNHIASAGKFVVIHNGISCQGFEANSHDLDVLGDLGIDRSRPIIATIVRLERQKGLEYLIKAVPLLISEIPSVQVIIAGDGPQRRYLENLAVQLGVQNHVFFLGWRDDVSDILTQIDVFCLPSLYEMFPYSILEALCMSCPVVATSVDGIPEVIRDGETGLLVPPRNPAALSDALARMLLDPQASQLMAHAGKRLVTTQFAVELMARRYADLFARPFHG